MTLLKSLKYELDKWIKSGVVGVTWDAGAKTRRLDYSSAEKMYLVPDEDEDPVVTSDAGQQESDEMIWRPLTPPAIDMPSHPPPRPPPWSLTPPVVTVPSHPLRPPPQLKTPRPTEISYPCSTISDSTSPARTTSPHHHPTKPSAPWCPPSTPRSPFRPTTTPASRFSATIPRHTQAQTQHPQH